MLVPFYLVAGLICAYILLVGPADFLCLRKLGRLPWTWVTLPVLVIVFAALVVITLFIQLLPGILESLASVLPEEFEPPAPADPESSYPDEDEIVAALGYILHTELQQRSG